MSETELQAIRQQVRQAVQEAIERWCKRRTTFALWNPVTGDRTHYE